MVFEDGEQRRDFVHVEDVARAFVLALEHPDAPGGVFNIGSGDERQHPPRWPKCCAARMGRGDLAPQILGKARAGDIRHCFADIARAREVLGFEPRHSLAQTAWVNWPTGCAGSRRWTGPREAQRELEARGLVA